MKETGKENRKTPVLIPVLVLMFIIGISVALYFWREQLQNLTKLGYFGIFLSSLLINLSLVMPLPTGIFVSAMGTIYNPFWVGIAAGTGAALGELSGYLAGTTGRKVIDPAGEKKIVTQLKKYGDFAIFFLALIPNPAFDIVGIAAGAIKIPLHRFLFWCWLGKVGKMLAFAYLGNFISLPWAFLMMS
jgi:uncharacterized membrane protein YdjX (TVP38/TMEM64 family)